MPAVVVSSGTATAADRTGPIVAQLPSTEVLLAPPTVFPFTFNPVNGNYEVDDIHYVATPTSLEIVFRGLTSPPDVGTDPWDYGQAVFGSMYRSFITTKGWVLCNTEWMPLAITEWDEGQDMVFNENALYLLRIDITDSNNISFKIYQYGDDAPIMTLALTRGDDLFANAEFTFKTGFPIDAAIAATNSLFLNDSTMLATMRLEVVDVPTPNAGPTDISVTMITSIAGLVGEDTVVAELVTTHATETLGFKYELVAGTGDTDNALFTIFGKQLRAAGTVTAGAKAIRVTTTDRYGLTYTKALTVTFT